MINENFVFLAAALGVLSGISYVWATLHGRAQPNRVTWLIWALAPFLATAGQLAHGVGWSTFMVFINGLMPFLVFLASFSNKQAQWKLTQLDYACGGLALLGLVLWLTTHHPVHAVVFSILSDTLAALPTVLKSWKKPESEDGRAFVISFVANIIGVLSIQQHSFIAYAFMVYITLANLVIVTLIYRHRILFLKASPHA